MNKYAKGTRTELDRLAKVNISKLPHCAIMIKLKLESEPLVASQFFAIFDEIHQS